VSRRWLVVGAGFTGAVMAERIASVLGERVLLIDRRDHVGGNAYDRADQHGVVVHKYGPHIFHTNSERVARHLSQFTAWRPYEHRVRGFVDGRMIPVPFNLTSLERSFGGAEGRRLGKILTDEFGLGANVPILKMRESPAREVRRVADFVYENVFLHYTTKQWSLSPEQLDPSVSARVPVRLSHDDRYFQDSFQQMPSPGFTQLFKRMLANPLIETRTGVAFDQVGETFNHVVFTGPIDEFFGYLHGPLPYRSFRFESETRQGDALVQECSVYNYPTPADQHAFTRSTEMRRLTGQSGVRATTLLKEYPEPYRPGVNEPYYPIPMEENRLIFRRYEKEAAKLRSVTFAGRLADYSYYNMDQAVARGLSAFEKQLAPSIA
jgi:UDP-galactopyranose mutase